MIRGRPDADGVEPTALRADRDADCLDGPKIMGRQGKIGVIRRGLDFRPSPPNPLRSRSGVERVESAWKVMVDRKLRDVVERLVEGVVIGNVRVE